FVYGRPSQLPVVRGHADHLTMIAVETIDDLVSVFRDEIPKGYDAVVHPMAVLDFQPDVVRSEKTGSGVEEWIVRLVPTPKVIGLVKELDPDTYLVGFKLEVGKTPEELREIAYQFLKKNRCDLVVANDLREIEEGHHTGYFITPDGRLAQTVVGKDAIARAVVEHLEAHLG
ncbi:MAG: phosphopantothenoylcysteine decarboxylase, partial [Armatimonadota bacterium]|nr:phosphopantothenoylcysteine decarboxylase [Armatimonadota bacterium]